MGSKIRSAAPRASHLGPLLRPSGSGTPGERVGPRLRPGSGSPRPAPIVRDRSANSSMRSPVTVNSHGWVLWALAADRGPDEIQWVVSRRVRLILAAVAPARADTACGPPRPSAKTRGGTDPHRPSGTRRVEGFMSTIQPSPGPERDLGDEHWQCRGIGSGDTVPKPAVVVSAIDPTRRAGPAGVA